MQCSTQLLTPDIRSTQRTEAYNKSFQTVRHPPNEERTLDKKLRPGADFNVDKSIVCARRVSLVYNTTETLAIGQLILPGSTEITGSGNVFMRDLVFRYMQVLR